MPLPESCCREKVKKSSGRRALLIGSRQQTIGESARASESAAGAAARQEKSIGLKNPVPGFARCNALFAEMESAVTEAIALQQDMLSRAESNGNYAQWHRLAIERWHRAALMLSEYLGIKGGAVPAKRRSPPRPPGKKLIDRSEYR